VRRSAWQISMRIRIAYQKAILVCKFFFFSPDKRSYARETVVIARQWEGKMNMLPGNAIPLEAQYLYRQALDLSMEGKKEDALRYLKKVVFIAPRFCNAYNAMGNCLDELGLYEDAIRKYDKVLDIDPHHTEARFKRNLVLEKITRNEGVKGNNGKITVLKREPDNHRIVVNSVNTQNREFPFNLMRIGLNC
jgi:tetratricopeptide (TPR) repeat protein